MRLRHLFDKRFHKQCFHQYRRRRHAMRIRYFHGIHAKMEIALCSPDVVPSLLAIASQENYVIEIVHMQFGSCCELTQECIEDSRYVQQEKSEAARRRRGKLFIKSCCYGRLLFFLHPPGCINTLYCIYRCQL